MQLSREQLAELISYDPDAGTFAWKSSMGRGRYKPGDALGSVVTGGYRRVKVGGEAILLHRLAWLFVHGDWPAVIDHINGDPSDNRILNLRNVTATENLQNKRKPYRNGTSGFLGVSKRGNRWRASIKHGSSSYHLGYFGSPEAAHQAYVQAKRQMHAGNTL